ncbi:MAG TPA: long-chain-fatty-acid--CoA ligase [Pseudonocardiaceae bacterium]|nr:long-chain-fatty-acid--CoA ligase [Pseudonocardiaceae bacterium]
MLLHDYLTYWAAAVPDKTCVYDEQNSWTYRQIDEWSDRVATVLADLGVRDGGRFGVLANNCAEWLPIYFGAFKCGAVPVPLNFRLHPDEWRFLLADSTATAVLVQDRYVDKIATVRAALDHVKSWVVIDGGDPQWQSLPALVERATPNPPRRPVIRPDHDLWQMYTSGTTGRPKGAVLTHASVNSCMIQAHLEPVSMHEDRQLIVMPLFHAGATMSMLSNLAVGATVRVMERFDAAECARVLEEERITRVSLVPAMIQSMLVEVPDISQRDYSNLRVLSYGAAPISEDTLRNALAVFDCGFRQGFGQTETSGALSCLTPRDHQRALAGHPQLLLSCGRPIVGTEIAIVDDQGNRVPVGQAGEIIARGPQMMRGYWNRPDADAATLVDGWLHTGDVGRLDAEGYLYICDRIKDMIVCGGENIYPREVENILFQMPQIADAAVIGVPDQKWGESVKAIVVLRPGHSATGDQVIAWTRARLATYKAPRSVDFLDALPRNPSGKVLKRELRKPYWQDTARNI